MSGPNIAPSASIPTPVSQAAPAAAEAQAGAAGEGSSATPFAAVLGKQLAQQSAKDTAQQKPDVELLAATGVETEAVQPATDNAALTALLPFLLNGTQPAKADEAPIRDAAAVIADASAALAVPMIQATAIPVAAEAAMDAIAGNNTANSATALGAGTAILAGLDTEAAASLATEPVQGSFENLLAAARESAHSMATGQAAPQSAANRPAGPELPVQTPVGAQGWDADVGNRLVWMAGRQESRAELVLTPPQMGRIEVSLTVSGDQATATFVSASPAVREALENALPRLREILAEAGVALGQTQVGSESAGQQAGERQNKDNSPRGDARAEDAGPLAGPLGAGQSNQWLRGGRTLVDVFA